MTRPAPFFSIVIPTYNRAERLAACLAALTRLDYPRARFEVIVVDDGSATPPAPAVAAVIGRLAITLRSQANAGPAAARNAGAARARGDYLAFTDDDCLPDPGWLGALARAADATPGHLIGGRTLNLLSGTLCSAASQLLIDYLYAYYTDDTGQPRFFASNNLAAPRARFAALGGFDTTFPLAAGEDREFCDRWLHAGGRLSHAPDAVVQHAHRLTPRSLWRQHFNYGRGAFTFRRARARRARAPVRVEPARFYLNLLGYPFGRAPWSRAVALAALLAVTQGANAAGFLWEGARQARSRPSRR